MQCRIFFFLELEKSIVTLNRFQSYLYKHVKLTKQSLNLDEVIFSNFRYSNQNLSNILEHV